MLPFCRSKLKAIPMPIDKDYAHLMFKMVENVQFLKSPVLDNTTLITILHYNSELDAKTAMSYFAHALGNKSLSVFLEIDINDNLVVTIEADKKENQVQFITDRYNSNELKLMQLPDALTQNDDRTRVVIQCVSPLESDPTTREVVSLKPNKILKKTFYGLDATLRSFTDYSIRSNIWRYQ